jgi:hypothetical protein
MSQKKKRAYILEPILHPPPPSIREGGKNPQRNYCWLAGPSFSTSNTRTQEICRDSSSEKKKKCKISSAMKKNESHFHKGIKIFRFLICFEQERHKKPRDKRNVIIVIFIFAFFCSLISNTYTQASEREEVN